MGNYLAHHGIKGQQWGIRRFQNADGSVTPAGAKRYYKTDVGGAEKNLQNAKSDYKNATKEYNKKTLGGVIYNGAAQEKRLNAANKLGYAKEDLKDEKIKEKLNSESDISNHRKKLEEHYKSKGMTDEEAAVAAYKRAKTEKILAVTAGLTLTAVAAYGAYKYHQYSADRLLPPGTTLQNISGFANRGVEDAFYASLNSNDNTTYRGWYGAQMRQQYGKAFESKFKATEGIKLASDKSAKRVFSEMIKNDPEFKSKVIKQMDYYRYDPDFEPKIAKARESIQSGKVDTNAYRVMNTLLVSRNDDDIAVKNRFYDALKNRGYDAISDLNDRRDNFFGSAVGYATKDPIIVFNGGGKFGASSREMLEEEIAKSSKKADELYARGELISAGSRSVALVGGATLASLGVSSASKRTREDAIVRKYKKEHPNTELSYKEIVRNHDNTKS